MRARTPKNFVLEERLELYADAIELQPARLRGVWAEACWPLQSSCGEGEEAPGSEVAPLSAAVCVGEDDGVLSTCDRRDRDRRNHGSYDGVVLDLGCGKGAYAVELAKRNPNVLYVGMDFEPICIAYAAQAAVEAGLKNAIFVPGKAELVEQIFASGELSCMHINFPTPYPRKKDAPLRLVSLEHLLSYRAVLAGELRLKTDSLPLREFALRELELAGYELVWQSEDARAEHPDDPFTLYEERLGEKGAKVYEIDAVVGELPEETKAALDCEPLLHQLIERERISLATLLPENLDVLDYVPYGMEATVLNMRNRRRNLEEKLHSS